MMWSRSFSNKAIREEMERNSKTGELPCLKSLCLCDWCDGYREFLRVENMLSRPQVVILPWRGCSSSCLNWQLEWNTNPVRCGIEQQLHGEVAGPMRVIGKSGGSGSERERIVFQPCGALRFGCSTVIVFKEKRAELCTVSHSNVASCKPTCTPFVSLMWLQHFFCLTIQQNMIGLFYYRRSISSRKAYHLHSFLPMFWVG